MSTVRRLLHDQHLHSRHSFDSSADPRDNVLAAIDRGLSGLTFTEHFDTHPDEWKECTYDDDAYSADIARLQDEFGDRIFVGKGIEICYQPERLDFILEFLSGHRFDLVLLSVHWTHGRPIHERPVIEEWGSAGATRRYLETVLEAARTCGRLRARHGRRCFDVLGHLDFVKRYTHRFLGETAVDRHGNLLDQIAAACLEADLVPEVNTSTIRGGLADPMPGPAFVRRYAAAGGTAMSLGSDAHKSEVIAADFDAVAAMLGNAGVTRQAVFQDRQATLRPLTPE